MILNATALAPGANSARTTVCIVGAGAAGITLACELDGSGIEVLLLEAGGYVADPAVDDDYVGQARAPHPPTTQFRRSVLGGTTGIWGGRCVPFDPIDFERRDYIADSGWPIPYQEVARYYPRALAYCDAGADEFSVAEALPGARPTLADLRPNPVLLSDRIERYSLPTDFGKRYRAKLAASTNVTTLLYARCVGLQRAPGSERIGAVEVVDQAGRRLHIAADTVVLATGGIEVPRLLFQSDPEGPGLGNHNDLLGRYYACHFENTCGRVVPGQPGTPFQFEKTRDGVYARRKLQFSDQTQREQRLLNTAFRLHFPEYSDARHGSAVMSAIFLAKSVLLPEYRAILQHSGAPAATSGRAAHLRNVACGLPALATFGAQWLFLRVLAQRKLPYTLVPNADGSFPLEFNCEQTPLAYSRITPSRERDRHGMRRVEVDWRVSQDDLDAAYRGFGVLRQALQQHSGSRLDYDDEQLRARLAGSVPLGGHHIGTARMADSPRHGVVDTHCALFQCPNLYLASAAVFPTSSHANPTLTIVALALRLADHLRAQRAAP
ncbi:choline dehydrogenase-like flavoprotein [Duganella sp. 1224]|uniref:GMC oxidoreductase n=1 Tax=Duganella sp. 1224 TaxID=2587052 RepID=UPI0015C73E26|nr:GMC family oxidoreductase [Duganella sp. 1224]NYE62152.1 choline dehydrogenase-like flavoprotein [Duganella sp. 1224]